ncbi:MAG: maleylpyruvate isomerase N-terminal domain-containing protein [Caldilineales bacterium]|nr:maleylpyruvate isomerase N-terminal domain-containing protein [Caldilineales bacterium]
MHARDILKYGHLTVLRGLNGLPMDDWYTENVCGWWSTKDIIAHLASFELTLVDILQGFLEGGPTPYLDSFKAGGQQFNDVQVARRSNMSAEQVLAEYQEAHERVRSIAARVPDQVYVQTGALPWYGMEYDLDDFIAYSFYGHKREHTAQINVFRDLIKR